MTPEAGRIYAWAVEHVLFPEWETWVRRRRTLEYLKLLRRTQWMRADAIEALQLDRLRRLLAHANANVPYYRELFRRIGFSPNDVRRREDLGAIPPLTKEIVRARYDDLVDPAHRGKNLSKGTSGSTGEPLKFEYCRDSESWRQATKMRGYECSGY